MSTWREERRADKAAEAEEARKNAAFNAKLAREERKAERDEKRTDQIQRRRDRAQRRQARAAKREKTLTPGNVYRRGTLILVGLSALASLPAQILHFAAISWMLAPIGPAVEGGAWVMNAGVAYADERKLPMWVRWLLRGLSLGAAGFAASVNYNYGTNLPGLTAAQGSVAGIGLAAVTLGGPLFFEVRQWVITLSEKGDPKKRAEEKAKAKHERQRRREFRKVAKRAKQIMLAAPYGTLTKQQAFDLAWPDIEGAPVSVTDSVISTRIAAEKRVADALATAERTPEQVAVELLLADIFGTPKGDGGPAGGARGKGPQSGPRGGGGGSTLTFPGRPAEGEIPLGGKGESRFRRGSGKVAPKPLSEEHLDTVRRLAKELGDPSKLSHSMVKAAVGGGRDEYLVRLRKAVQNESR
ncbi:hypothetical protein [Streptomyces bugieae]|uniref:DUF2637 domain-containing protein n=1 Tax=Streptomyces bugieae TaxID=3098223 RepID=A0ABU7NKY6_9ACTN|nr:hypothetical protein [Streptomyces sp. DSM 41528]